MREWRVRHKEKLAEYNRKYFSDYLADSKKLDANRKRARQWGRDNSELAVERANLWRAGNLDKARENGRRSSSKRIARIKCVEISPIDYDAVIARGAGKCGICGNGITGKYEFDHIFPLSKGGAHSTGNLQIAHMRCNRRKHNRIDYK